MSSLLRSSKFVRLFASAARNLVTSTRYSAEIRQSQVLTAPSLSCLRSFASAAASSSNFTSSLEKSLYQIDQDVRRMGRVSRKELEEVLEEIKQSRNATSSQSLLLIRCCGSLVPEELPEVRTKLVQEIWATLEKLKIPMDISHYNALLRVYLENEHKFSPAEFLQELEKKGVEPNRVTYQRLITRYCQDGDIEGATRILEFMREKSLPVNENVFNALVMGHAQSDDMESAAGILTVMKQAGLDPSSDTYTTLLVGHAKKGDMDAMRKILNECDQNEIFLTDKDYLEIVFALATNGHAAHVDEIIARIRKSAGFSQDAISYILRLVNNGQEEVATKIWQVMPRLQRDENENVATRQGNFLIRQMVKAQRPIESILKICKVIESEGMNNRTLLVAAEACLLQGDIAASVKILKILKEGGAPIRQHYFWPMLCSAGLTKNDDSILNVLSAMNQDFGLSPTNETIREYVVPNLSISNPDQIIGVLKRVGVSSGSTTAALVVDYLLNGAIADAAAVASKYRAYFNPALLRRPLTNAYLKTGATDHYLNLIHHVYEGMERSPQNEELENPPIERKEIVGFFLQALLQFGKDKSFNLDAILQGLLERGLGITHETAEHIQSRLSGEKLTNEISELLIKLTANELQAVPAQRSRIPQSAFDQNEDLVKQRIAKQEEAGFSSSGMKKNLLVIYTKNQEVDKALEVFNSMGDEAGAGSYAYVIDALAVAGRVDEALDILKKFRTALPDALLNPLKIVHLVNAMFKLDRFDEGFKVLEECPSSGDFDETPFALKSAVFQVLNTLAEKGDVEKLDKAFELIVKKNFVEITNVILGPLIKGRILKNDIDGAMAKFEECVEKYKMTPWKGELVKKLIEAEDAASLQRITDASSKVHGEINSLYDLVFAFVECGRIRQARKILETPGLRNRSGRMNMICERYQQEGTVSALEGLLEATKDMSHIDRRDIFQHLLSTHIKNDHADKALGVWTQMQEEDVHPTDAFLVELAEYLEKKGMPVPFVKPQVEVVTKKEPQRRVERKADDAGTPGLVSFKNAIRSGQWERAKTLKNELAAKNVQIPANELSLLLEGFVQTNQLSEAYDLAMNMLKNNVRFVPRHLKFFVSKLSMAGDVDKLSKIGEVIDSETKKSVSFDNKLCAGYLVSGRAAEYVDKLLKDVETAAPNDVKNLEENFPRGAISGIIEAHPELLPKAERIVELYGKLGSKVPAVALWGTLFILPEMESRADKVWETYQLSEEPRLLFQRIITRARNLNSIALVHRLLNQVKDSKISEPALGIIHSCAIDVLVANNKHEEALEQLNAAVKDVSLENINATCLQRLQQGLKTIGKEFPYTIPSKLPRKILNPENRSDPLLVQLVGFDSSALKKPDRADWKTFLHDQSGLLSQSQTVFDPYRLFNLKPPEKKNKSSSSSSSDDETEEKSQRK